VGRLTPTLSLNESDIRDLEHVTLRAPNDAAVMKIGSAIHHQCDLRSYLQLAAISQVVGTRATSLRFFFNFEDWACLKARRSSIPTGCDLSWNCSFAPGTTTTTASHHQQS